MKIISLEKLKTKKLTRTFECPAPNLKNRLIRESLINIFSDVLGDRIDFEVEQKNAAIYEVTGHVYILTEEDIRELVEVSK